MSTNNNNNETAINSNEDMNNKVQYIVEIADDNGHTTVVSEGVEKVVSEVISRVEKNPHWVFINSVPFQFVGSQVRSEANLEKFRTELNNNPGAHVTLTGVMKGGNA
jgi:hypothetical protein